MPKLVRTWVKRIQNYVDRWWYAPLLGFLACIDLFVVVVPTDGIVVSSSMLAPRRWLAFAVFSAVGSSLGCWLLALLLQRHGLPFLLELKPGIDQSGLWIWTHELMEQWGGWTLFAMAASPLMQHPAVALAAIGGMAHTKIFAIVLVGRALKFLLIAYVSTHAPGLLRRLWGIQGDLKEVGVKPPQ